MCGIRYPCLLSYSSCCQLNVEHYQSTNLQTHPWTSIYLTIFVVSFFSALASTVSPPPCLLHTPTYTFIYHPPLYRLHTALNTIHRKNKKKLSSCIRSLSTSVPWPTQSIELSLTTKKKFHNSLLIYCT